MGVLGGLVGLGGAEFRLPLRYSRDQAFTVLAANRGFVVAMAAGSVTGSVVGGLLLGVVPEAVIVPLLVALLLYSAVKVWRHA